jgi:hypothetical protein
MYMTVMNTISQVYSLVRPLFNNRLVTSQGITFSLMYFISEFTASIFVFLNLA